MKICVLSNWSDKIAELHSLTAINKQAYCDLHGYDFIDIKADYCAEEHVKGLERIRDLLKTYDVVMGVGCDVLFTNQSIRIEDKLEPRGLGQGNLNCKMDSRVIIAREHISWWPINNDVVIWPRGNLSTFILEELINTSKEWLQYPWLWQIALWNFIQPSGGMDHCVRLVEAREMNSTFQPFIVAQGGLVQRTIGPSSWQLGDWILHALDMSLEMRVQVIKWALPFVGDGTWRPTK